MARWWECSACDVKWFGHLPGCWSCGSLFGQQGEHPKVLASYPAWWDRTAA